MTKQRVCACWITLSILLACDLEWGFDPHDDPEPVIIDHEPGFTLASAAASAGKRVGTAVSFGPLVNEPIYAERVAAEFSAITPENATKWASLQPSSRQRWDFAEADAIVELADEHGQAVKGHTLVWHNALPPFVDDSVSANAFERMVRDHVRKTVRHFAHELRTWDVVNEAVADDGSLRDTIYLRKFGPAYIGEAFRAARESDRHARLFYNDYNIDVVNAKSDAVYDLVASLREECVPIHGVGFQMHLAAEHAPSVDEITENFARFAELGLRIEVSELDVRIANVPGSLAERLAVQKRVYHHAIAACVRTPACDTVTTWGFTDRHSWIDGTFGPDDPLLFDEGYNRKPAYYGAFDAFVGISPDPLEAPLDVIPNGSFEAGPDGWFAFGSGTVEATNGDAWTGNRSGRVTGRTASWNGIAHDLRPWTTPGRSYAITGRARIAGAASAPLSLTAAIACHGQATEFLQLATATGTDAEWVELAGELVIPDCESDQLTIYVEGPDAGIDVLVDDVAVRKQSIPLGPNLVTNPGFEDGTAGWVAWGGAAIATTTENVHAGQFSGVVTGRTETWQGGVWELGNALPTGARHQVGLFGRIGGAASANGNLTAQVRCAGEADQFRQLASATLVEAEWTALTGTLEVPDCALEGIAIYLEGPPAGVSVFMDDLSVRREIEHEPVNLVSNGDFEINASGWTAWGGVIGTTTLRVHGGAKSGIVTGRTADWNGPVVDLFGVLEAGQSAHAEAWVSIAGAPSSPVHLTARIGCAGEAQVFQRLGSVTANDVGWVQVGGTLELPECTLADLVLYAEGPAGGIDLLIDDVRVTAEP